MVSIKIIDVFIKLRETLASYSELQALVQDLRAKTNNNTKNIELVFAYLDELIQKEEDPKPKKLIGYKTNE